VIEFDFGSCVFRVWPEERRCETVFPDGTSVVACPEDNDIYRACAKGLGYGTDTWELCFTHEILHTLLAQANGQLHSWVLHDVAHGRSGLATHDLEEKKVLDFQAKLRACRGQ
jgi:hypothetical protein